MNEKVGLTEQTRSPQPTDCASMSSRIDEFTNSRINEFTPPRGYAVSVPGLVVSSQGVFSVTSVTSAARISLAMNTPSSSKPVIGIVGGIGAGKSTASAALADLGCAVIDADAVGHAVIDEQDVQTQLRERWGDKVFAPDGPVDRTAIGEIVFNDPTELEALNSIMWPPMGERIAQLIAQAASQKSVPATVLDAAVLFEAGWDELCTHVLFVDSSDADRAQRAAARGLDYHAWQSREKTQISLDMKRSRCYRTLDNSTSVSHLQQQVRLIYHQILHERENS